MGNRYNVSLTEEIHEKGVKDADRIGLKFSTYVAYLILKNHEK